MFASLPNALFTTHNGLSGGRGLSPRLWSRPDGQALSPDGYSNGIFQGDDFTNFGALATGVVAGYGVFLDTSCTLSQTAVVNAGSAGGVVRMTTTAVDGAECALACGGVTGASFKLDGGPTTGTAGHDQMLVYEARFKVGSVAATARNLFFGLTEQGCAVTDGLFSDSDVFGSKSLIGFYTVGTASQTLKFGWKNGAAAITNLTSAGSDVTVATLVADTWYKVGFIYNPAAPAGSIIKVYVDNVQNAATVARSSIVSSAGAAVATFPCGIGLTPHIGMKNGALAAIQTCDIDWYACFQHGPTANTTA